MKYDAIIKLWGEDKFSIYVPALPGHGLNSQGSTLEEAKNGLFKGINEYIEMYREQSEEIPDALIDVEFHYKYDLKTFFDFFDWINVTKLASKLGINNSLLRQYKKGLTLASEKQAKKIIDGIHLLGIELSNIHV